jgi:hypothetical protein
MDFRRSRQRYFFNGMAASAIFGIVLLASISAKAAPALFQCDIYDTSGCNVQPPPPVAEPTPREPRETREPREPRERRQPREEPSELTYRPPSNRELQADADRDAQEAKLADKAARKHANIAGYDTLQFLRDWNKRDVNESQKTLAAMKDRLQTLHNLEAKLIAKQAELAKWRDKMIAEKGEFDRLHAETAHGEIADVIGIIPSEAVLSHLLDRGMISAKSAAKLNKAFRRLKDAGRAAANTADARNQKDYVKVQLSSTQDLIKELITISSNLPLDSPERIWELRTVKALDMFGATAQAMLGDHPSAQAQWWERAEPVANLAADLVGIAIPPFGTGVKVERIIDRRVQMAILNRAQNRLGGAISDNWNADEYLTQKLELVKSDIAEVQHHIDQEVNWQKLSASR